MKELDSRRYDLLGRKKIIFIKEKRSETWSSSYLQETVFAKLKFKRQSLFTKYLCLWFPSQRLLKYFLKRKIIRSFAYAFQLTEWNLLVFTLCYWLKWKSLWTAIRKLPTCNLFHKWPCSDIAVTGHWRHPATPQHRRSLRTKTFGCF